MIGPTVQGQPSLSMTEGGIAFIQGLLPILRGYGQRIDDIATRDLPMKHPDFEAADEIRDQLNTVVLMVGALATRADTGIEDGVALHRIWSEIGRARAVADMHCEAREKAQRERATTAAGG